MTKVSARPLAPADVLRRLPGAQAAPLPDGRWLVRHAGGLSLLGGPAAAVLPDLLFLVDGERSLDRIAGELAGEVELGPLLDLVRGLLGEAVERVDDAPEPAAAGEVLPSGSPRIALITAGAEARASEAIAAALRAAGLTDLTLCGDEPADGLASLAGAEIVLVVPGALPYSRLLSLQAELLGAGLPSLFATADPDGLRIGPATLPGVSPCLGCREIAALGFLGRPAAESLATAGGFSTLAPDAGQLASVAEALAAEAGEIARPNGTPRLLRQILLVAGERARRLPLERAADCPLCGGMAPAATDLAARAARQVAEAADRRPPRAVFSSDRSVGSVRSEGGEQVRSVGILGGGTAGYLTALALRRKVPGVAVTLLESSEVPIIGVGEATTPLMPQFLHVDLGLDVHQLFREVRPTLKLGIRFLWGPPETGDFHYPFGPLHLLEPLAASDDLKACSLQSLLMEAGAAPLYPAGPAGWSSSLGTATAYHLDNQRFVAYLERRAAEAGVRRVEATIAHVEASADGEEVAALVDRDGRRFSFDLYIDATGFRSLLLEGTLGSPWVSFDRSLWTDRAVVAPAPHGGRMRPYTTAETLSCGWCWSIAQDDADHRGYVFASAFQTPEAAEAEMRQRNPGMGEARLVRFRAGRHAHFWKGNVVALGNAYGFVEPLESTSLHLLIRELGLLTQSFPLKRGERALPELWNRQVAGWWDYLAWFLALHYRFNRRQDSPFWRECREKVDVSSHAELLAAFLERGPLSYDPAIPAAFDYPDPLWGPEGIDTLLLGQGVLPRHLPRPALDPRAWQAHLGHARATAARAVRHERALDLFASRPEILEEMAAAFRAVGPAFAGKPG